MAADLYEAIAAWFLNDPTLSGAFPGGLLAARAAPAVKYPYAKVAWRKPQPSLSLEDEPYQVTFTAYAMDDDAAMDAGLTLTRQYLDPTRAALEFSDQRNQTWRESARIEQEQAGPDVADYIAATEPPGEDGVQEDGYVWRVTCPFEVWVVPAGP